MTHARLTCILHDQCLDKIYESRKIVVTLTKLVDHENDDTFQADICAHHDHVNQVWGTYIIRWWRNRPNHRNLTLLTLSLEKQYISPSVTKISLQARQNLYSKHLHP